MKTCYTVQNEYLDMMINDVTSNTNINIMLGWACG